MRLALAPLALVAGLSFGSSGCTYAMHEYQAGGYAPATPGPGTRQGGWIHARSKQHVILGITDNTDYVDEAYAELVSQCPGDIVGVNTRFSTSLSFLSYTNVIDMQATCLK
jgi:hypothetical protein